MRRAWGGLALAMLMACAQPAGPIGPDHDWVWDGFVADAKVYVSYRLNGLQAREPLQGGALFVGDSLTEMAPLRVMFPYVETENYGIGWDTTEGVLARMPQILRNRPDRVFLMIGTNDHRYDHPPERIAGNVREIVEAMKAQWPRAEFYLISILPREAKANERLSAANALMRERADEGGYVWLDLAAVLTGPDGQLDPRLHYDGLHLNVRGYAAWADAMAPCVMAGCPGGLPVSGGPQG